VRKKRWRRRNGTNLSTVIASKATKQSMGPQQWIASLAMTKKGRDRSRPLVLLFVMPGLVPGIHVFFRWQQ
jgi:hypothetical protein